MSVRMMTLVWNVRGLGGSAERLVLLKLADCANDEGTHAHPKINTLAHDCELDRSTVKRTLKKLLDDGLIEVEQEHTTRLPNMYRLVVPTLKSRAEDPDAGEDTPAPRGCKLPPQRVQDAPPEGAGCPPRGVIAVPPPSNVISTVSTPEIRTDLGAQVAPHPIKAVLTVFDELFTGRYGDHPHITGKEAKLAKALIDRHGYDNVVLRLHQFFDVEDDFFAQAGYSFSVFAASWAKVVARSSPAAHTPALVSEVSKGNLANAEAALRIINGGRKAIGSGGKP